MFKEYHQLQYALAELYLDYFNNYLTLEKFAKDYGFGKTRAKMFISMGKKAHNKRVADTNFLKKL